MSSKSLQQKGAKRKHEIIGTVIKVNGRTVGQVYDGEFVKDLTSEKQLVKYPVPAIASDIQALKDAQRAGAEYCTFTYTVTGIIYRVAISKIWELGERFNCGWGDQIKLPLPNWTQTRDPNLSASVTPEYSEPSATDEAVKPLNIRSKAPTGIRFKPGKQTPRQMSLFKRGW